MMRTTRLWGLVLVVLTGGCGAELALPEDAAIECSSELDCPFEFECNTAINRCEPVVTNSPPLVTLEILPASPRWLRGVTVRAVVADVDSDPVDLDLRFALSGGGACPANIDPAQGAITNLESSPTGVEHFFVWTALADAQGEQNCGLRSANVLASRDTSRTQGPCLDPSLPMPAADANPDVVVDCVVDLERLSLFASPTDQGADPRTGGEVEASDVIGDRAPFVVPVLSDTEYEDIVPVEFFVVDEVTDLGQGADTVDVEVQFSIDEGATWADASVFGPTTRLPSAPRNPSDVGDTVSADPEADATAFVVVWEADEDSPGGIGESVQDALIRMRGITLFGDNAVVGEWRVAGPVRVDTRP